MQVRLKQRHVVLSVACQGKTVLKCFISFSHSDNTFVCWSASRANDFFPVLEHRKEASLTFAQGNEHVFSSYTCWRSQKGNEA